MNTKLFILLFYLIIVNLLSIIITVTDKYKAKHKKWRISEKTLFIFAGLGAAGSMFLTMLSIRHKTKHKRFMIVLPLMFILQIVLIYVYLFRFCF